MPQIQLLDNSTIDKIAAGEVVERPSSVVKELVENSIDAGATALTVEIKEGGISFIRVTDNGEGIPKEQVRNAFLRHATSKIRNAEDLNHIHSLGFRGEALSSIAAVAQVEIMTKTRESLLGVRLCLEDGRETEFQEVGVPEGTTILVKNLFFHTPARKKFLKTAATEGGYIGDLCEHLAMSNPNVSFRFIVNNQVKFHTSGNGDVQEIIYRIFGREVLKELVPIDAATEGMQITGFLGKPVLNRSNRNFENCFVNGRFVKSSFLCKATEEGYKAYLMQHKFPFAVLYFSIDTEKVDVNVHPTKMDIRITDSPTYFAFISEAIGNALKQQNMIPAVEEREPEASVKEELPFRTPEPFEKKRWEDFAVREEAEYRTEEAARQESGAEALKNSVQQTLFHRIFGEPTEAQTESPEALHQNVIKAGEAIIVEAGSQRSLFEEELIPRKPTQNYRILGQVFATYWLLSCEDKLYFVDQHAAHEKIKYERLMAQVRESQVIQQFLNPPLILHLTGKEEAVLEEFSTHFEGLGFSWEDFGSHSIAMRAMPVELYGKSEKEFFQEILDELVENGCKGTPEVITEKIASMSCKAAVKGNQSMTAAEMDALMEQLFTLENPYHCPHGRPTMISMSKQELEKKFKRIV